MDEKTISVIQLFKDYQNGIGGSLVSGSHTVVKLKALPGMYLGQLVNPNLLPRSPSKSGREDDM